MNKKYKNLFYLLFFLYIFMLFFTTSLRLNTQTIDENEFKLFLNLVIQSSPYAKEAGYDFIKKYPNSSFISDVLFYLSFVENDYFQNIINLKKVILYYPYSLWRESSLIRLLTIYFLHDNFIQFDQWYNYYLENFSIKNRRWEVEILYLKMLYKNKELDRLNEKVEFHLKNAKNYQLLSYCILLKSYLFQRQNNITASKRQLLIGLSMFEFSNYYETYIYELYKISFREERPYYAKKLLNFKIFPTLNNEEKEEIKKIAALNNDFKPQKIMVEELKRDYFFISLGYSSDKDKLDEIVNSFKKIGITINLKKINETVYQLYIGYFHFKSEAQEILKKISSYGYSGELVFVDYSY